MECYFGGHLEISKIDWAKFDSFIDFMILIKHQDINVLLVSNLYTIKANLELMVGYFKYRKLDEIAEELLRINNRYQKLLEEKSLINEALETLENLKINNGFLALKEGVDANKQEMNNLRNKIKTILQEASIKIIDMWDYGCPAIYVHSLIDFPQDGEKVSEVYEKVKNV